MNRLEIKALLMSNLSNVMIGRRYTDIEIKNLNESAEQILKSCELEIEKEEIAGVDDKGNKMMIKVPKKAK